MTTEKRLDNLENLVRSLISKINNDNFYANAETAGVRKGQRDISERVDDITPYTETKTAYIDDTDITFFIPTDITGNITVFFPYEYSMERMHDRIIITFEPLEEVTDITISIL